MKKFLLTIACSAVAALTFGQKDIAITHNLPTDGTPYNSGDVLSVEVTIENVGVEDIDIATDTIYYILTNGGNIFGGASLETLIPTLAAGASQTVTIPNILTFPDNVPSGSYTFCSNAVIFSDTVVDEVDFLNNEDCFSVDLTTPIASVNNEVVNTTNVYPNPATSTVNFELSQGAEEIVIYDVNGKTVKTVAVANEVETINVTELENGVYFYAIRFENGEVKQERLVVSK